MARIGAFALAIVAAVVIATDGNRPAAVTPALAQATLPPGEGALLVVSRCLICHSTEIATQQRQGPRGWTEIVDRMVTYGMPPMTPHERATLLAYLLQHFGDPEGR